MAVDEDDIGTLYESIVDVLADECGSIELHKFYNGETTLDAQLWTRAAELGWTAIALPEEQGGLGMGVRGLVALFGALGRFAVPDTFLATLPAAQWLADVADESLAAQILPGVIAGEVQIAVPAAPGGARLALAGGKLDGTSSALIGSPAVSVAILPTAQGYALVRLDAPGVSVRPIEMWDRTRVMLVVECAGVEPIGTIADPDGAAGAALLRYLSIAVAADSIGGARRIAEQTVDYLKTREQFGRPLASFQALKHRVANLMFAIEPADELVKQAVETAEAGDPYAPMWSALAKEAAVSAFGFVADDCLQLHGGVGFTWEFDCHIFLKRALLNQQIAGDRRAQLDSASAILKAASAAGITTAELAA